MIVYNQHMSQTINMTAVYIADYVGVLLLALILIARGWELPGRKDESRILLILIIATMINCLVDPFIFVMDGQPGRKAWAMVVFGNSALFLYNLIVGTGMVLLVVKHIRSRISKFQYVTVWFLAIMETVLLIINFFKPLVFSVDENNVYKRESLYFVYIAAAFYLMLYSVGIYLFDKRKKGSLRYFPVWEFVLPIIIGVTIQTVFYGVSAQPVSFAVAFCSIVICLQKEYLYIDKLTGVYNRYEFDKIIKNYVKRRKVRFAAVMIDMNSFKSINDDHSHVEGDEALRNMAQMLVAAAGDNGNVIRFAGDEFVVIIDYQGEDTISRFCDSMNAAINAYNASSGKPYILSAAMGGEVFDVEDASYVIGRIDRLMYENKVEYYKDHDRRGR